MKHSVIGLFLLPLWGIVCGCGTEPNIHNTIGGKMMKRISAYTTYARNSPTNLFYSAAVCNGTLFAGSDRGLFIEKNGSLEKIILDGLPQTEEVRVFRLHPTEDSALGKILYAATSRGLYRYLLSSGKTEWLQTDPSDTERSVEFLSVTTDKNGIIYAGTNENGIYISQDSGKTWIHHAGSDFLFYTGQSDLTYEDYKNTEKSDPDFPLREGLIKIQPHYRGEMKSTTVTDICIFEDKIYAATFGGGISYTLLPESFSNWNPYWITYLRPWYFFTAASDNENETAITKNREEEALWTLNSRFVRRISVQSFGIFAATAEGLSYTSHGESFGDKDTSNQIPQLDDLGCYQYFRNEENRPVYTVSIAADDNGIVSGNQNLKKKLWPTVRIWHEYGSDGLERTPGYQNEKELKEISEYSNGMIGAGLESDYFTALHFGQINGGKNKLFYAGTECGLSISELRQYSDVTGENYTSADLTDSWVTYHNALTAFEETWVTDIAVETDSDGNDSTVYVASNGQGLIVFQWEE